MAKLTNEQKYKTAEERVRAHDSYCVANPECVGECTHKCIECMAHWLALEAEAEKERPNEH